MKLKILAIIIAIGIFLIVVNLVRRQKLTFRYAIFWMALSLFAILVSFNENLLFGLARMLGFELPSNFIFFLIGLFFVISSLLLTVYTCQQNSHLETMAQRIGILEYELSEAKKEISSIKEGSTKK